MDKREAAKLAKQYKLLEKKADAIKKQMEDLEKTFKADMEASGADEIDAGAFTVTWKMIHSSRFDSKKFKADHSDVYALYKVPNDYRKFDVA